MLPGVISLRSVGDRPGRSVRIRLTMLYGSLFTLCGAALLAITYVLVAGAPFAPPSNYGGAAGPPGFSGNVPHGIAVERHLVLSALLLRSGVALGVMALVSAWLGWIVAGRVLRPLRVITERTRQITEASLHERLSLTGPEDEIKVLGDTIDGLLSRLEDAFENQRRFMANVSHELRTPLTMIRTSLDVAAGKPHPMSSDARVISSKVREGLERADRLVDSFLMLARAEANGLAEIETIALDVIVRDALAAADGFLLERQLTVHPRLNEARLTGSTTLMQQLVANLIENAIRHNKPSGEIKVETASNRNTSHLIIESDGDIITPEVVGRLGSPFQRAQADRTGSDAGVGMGLAIVAAICTAHQGHLYLHARPKGGLKATVTFPQGSLTNESAVE
jgi:signal transduction histidine kinase